MHPQTMSFAVTAAFSLLTNQALAQSYTQEATGPGFFITVPTTGVAAPTGTPSANGLPGLVSQLPDCAIPCFQSAAQTVKCTLSDFSCLCQSSNLNSFAINMGSCLGGGIEGLVGGKGGASSTDDECDITKLAALATQICARVNSSPDQAELSSASAVVSEKLAESSATGTGAGNSQPTSDSKNEAGSSRKNDGAAMGMLAIVAAYAVLAL